MQNKTLGNKKILPLLKNKGERVREADGKRAQNKTLAPSLEGRGWGWVIKT